MTNEVNWGFTHNSILIDEDGNVFAATLPASTLPLLYPSADQKDYIPAVTVSTATHRRNSAGNIFGTGNAPFVNYNTTIDISDNLTKVWGNHTIKAGFYMQRSRKDQTSFANANGSYNFGDNSANPVRHRLRLLQRAVGCVQHVQPSQRLHQRPVSLLEHRRIRAGHLEGHAAPDPRLRYARAWYQPQYDSSLQASTFLPSQLDADEGAAAVSAGVNPGTPSSRSPTIR